MKRAVQIAVTALALLGVSSAVTGAGAMASTTAPTGEMVKAIVVLAAQVDPATVHAPTQRQRGAAIERALRARASSGQRGVLSLLRRRMAQGLATHITPLWIINGISVTAAPSVIRELSARTDVREVDPDLAIAAPASVPGSLTGGPPEPNVALVNAPALWDLGYRGQGVVVANMDTGVDSTHPDLAGRWRGGTNSWYDPNGEHPTTPTDISGHGTSTMGVMVGGDAGGTSVGMAPDATWVAVKIFNDHGLASSTAIHLGYQWLLDPDGNPNTADAPDVVNNSWTMSTGGCNLSFQLDLRNLRNAGILPVFSAGNYGPTAGTVLSPANNPEAFAVGNTDNSDVLDSSSSRGPSACGAAVTPSLVAPGVNIHTTDLYGFYTDVSGTSLSAPHVAGALALLLSAFPDLPADRQAAALASSAVDLGAAGPDNDYGYGRLDTLAAYTWLATAPDFTVAASPSTVTTTPGGTASYSIPVTAVNGFADDVSFSIAGLSPAQASWSFTPPVVTGGSGSSQLDVVTSASIAPGSYSLTMTATSATTTRNAYATLVIPAPPDFGIGVSPTSRSIGQGLTTAPYTVSVTALNGFTGTVALSLTGLAPTVGTATFTPPTVAGAGSSSLTIATLATAPTGSYPLTIRGTSGSLTHTVAATLVVTARGFTLSVTPSSVTVTRGQTATYTVSTASVGGYTGSASLTVSGLPANATATFTPNPIAIPASGTLKVKTTSSTTRGTFTLTVRATSGAFVKTTTVTLVVR